MSSIRCQILPIEQWRYFTEWADLYTGVSKQSFIETLIMAKNLSQKSEKDQPGSAAAEHLWGRGQVTCSLWTPASSPLKQEGQSWCSFFPESFVALATPLGHTQQKAENNTHASVRPVTLSFPTNEELLQGSVT